MPSPRKVKKSLRKVAKKSAKKTIRSYRMNDPGYREPGHGPAPEVNTIFFVFKI
jgi:hypothetical protein